MKVKWFLIGDRNIDAFMSSVDVVNFGIKEGRYKVTYLEKMK